MGDKIIILKKEDAEQALENALVEMKGEDGDYKSWKHCYSAFQKTFANRKKDNIETLAEKDVNLLALHLGFYLASWGMYRSGFIKHRDYTIHKAAVNILYDYYKKYDNTTSLPITDGEIDKKFLKLCTDLYNGYLKTECKKVYSASELRKELEKKGTPTDTLLTKVLLGTLGNVPAYDRYFKDGMCDKKMYGDNSKARLKNAFPESLIQLNEYAEKNNVLIDNLIEKIKPKFKEKEEKEEITIPTAKILDVIIFQIGFDAEKNKTN